MKLIFILKKLFKKIKFEVVIYFYFILKKKLICKKSSLV